MGKFLGLQGRKNGHSQALDSRKRHPSPANFSEASPAVPQPDTKPGAGPLRPLSTVPLLADCSRQAAGRRQSGGPPGLAAAGSCSQARDTSELCPSFQPACHSQTTQAPLPQRRRCKELAEKLEKNQYILLAKKLISFNTIWSVGLEVTIAKYTVCVQPVKQIHQGYKYTVAQWRFHSV